MTTLATLLDKVEAFLTRFVAYPSIHARRAHVLWIAHSHCMDAWDTTPRLAFLSPEPGSGKTRALEITELLVPAPVLAVNVTPAYLFRKVGDPDGPPTVLFDEIDTVFGPKARDNEELRGLLNAGHRRGATAGRCAVQGKTVVTEEIPAYAAVAMAGLGNLPDTILTRSIVVRMRRRASNERVEPFRRRVHRGEGEVLRRLLARHMSGKLIASLEAARPDMPAGVEDRDADIWEPLIAIADEAGGSWPEWARAAAVELVGLTKQRNPSLGIRLLGDIRDIFRACDVDRMSSRTLLDRLNSNIDAPWGDLNGKPLDERGIARMLKEYDVRSVTIRMSDQTGKGYRRADLVDAWSRYLPEPSPESVTSDTSGTGSDALGGAEVVPTSASPSSSSSSPLRPLIRGVTDVSDVSDVGEERAKTRSAG